MSPPDARQTLENALEPFNPALGVVMRRVLQRVGRDVTHETVGRPTLVMAPHPDDETLGAGATIMRKVEAGTPVHVLVVTDGSKAPEGDPLEVAALRSAELDHARTILGLSASDVTELGFVDAELNGDDEELVAALAQVVAALRPAEILVTGDTDPHADHAALAVAARRAVAGSGARLLTYPIWQFEKPLHLVRQMWRSGRAELVRTQGFRERKRAAVVAYHSQLAASDDAAEGLHPSFLANFDTEMEIFFPDRFAR